MDTDEYNIDIQKCKSMNSCSKPDDYRPIQKTLLTRFSKFDYENSWETTNQDYGAFYYQQFQEYCVPDNLKYKVYQRYNHFQDWLTYQMKHQNSLSESSINNDNNRKIFPSHINETIRITHRKQYPSNCIYEMNNNEQEENKFSSCNEYGLINNYIVKKIFQRLKCFLNPVEYNDVIQCAQILVTEILTHQPTLYLNEIIDQVIRTMTMSRNSTKQTTVKSCCLNNCEINQPSNMNNNQFISCTNINKLSSSIDNKKCQSIKNIFDKLCHIENEMTKISNQCIRT